MSNVMKWMYSQQRSLNALGELAIAGYEQHKRLQGVKSMVQKGRVDQSTAEIVQNAFDAYADETKKIYESLLPLVGSVVE